ncbi:MAG: cell division protein SepF [Archaeoglobaceae archaeon]
MGVLDKLFGKQEKVPIEEFEEIDLSDYEAEISQEAEMFVKVAEVTGLTEIPQIKREIYDGNIVIADIAFVKHDKLTLDRILKDLRQLAEDVKGDIVGLGEDYVIITPTGIKVDRNKIRGGR